MSPEEEIAYGIFNRNSFDSGNGDGLRFNDAKKATTICIDELLKFAKEIHSDYYIRLFESAKKEAEKIHRY